MKKLLLFFITVPALFWTCSTEVDLLADYKEVPVIYCLLDQTQPKQYVRIQKAFLGPDNALTMAQEMDSIFYATQLNVIIEEWNNNVLTNSWQLQTDTIPARDPGLFYSGAYIIYSLNTTTGMLNPNRTYKLRVRFASDPNKEAYSTTVLVKTFNFAPVTANANSVQIVKVNSNSRVSISWNPSATASFYQTALRFYYREHDVNGNTTLKSTPEWVFGSLEQNAGAVNALSMTYDPDAFYRFLVQSIPDDPNVVWRDGDSISYTVYAAGEDLYTYMRVNSPSSSLVQERPTYSNILTTDPETPTAIGVFGSRSKIVKRNIQITQLTEDTLSRGYISCGLKFRDRNQAVLGCQ
ncbi:MAG: hypothetical protein MUC87_15710 [Bacteroidia bacterium]|jgi:hypothetical protein|nr:hypothetical protein [Bacteroidia bacterium]